MTKLKDYPIRVLTKLAGVDVSGNVGLMNASDIAAARFGNTQLYAGVDYNTLTLDKGIIPLKVGGAWTSHVHAAAVNAPLTTTLTASTTYFVYARDNGAGGITLEFSTTAPVMSNGVMVKSGDETRTLVGKIRTDAAKAYGPHGFGSLNYAVHSWFSPDEFIRTDYHFFNNPISNGNAMADNSSTFTYLGNAVSANYMESVPFPHLPWIGYAQLEVIWSTSNINNQIKLIHADDGPANITTVVTLSGDGSSNPIKTYGDCTSVFQGLQNGQLTKNLGVQYKKVNASTFDLWTIVLKMYFGLGRDFYTNRWS